MCQHKQQRLALQTEFSAGLAHLMIWHADNLPLWDAEFLMKVQALPLERIKGVETGGCPHTAIREDASINMLAVENMKKKFPDLDLILIESGGDNLAATFSPELVDLSIYVIDVGMGGDIPRL